MEIAYKVLYLDSGKLWSIHYPDEWACPSGVVLKYTPLEITKAKFGKLFVFREKQNAQYFREAQVGSQGQVWEVVADELGLIKCVCRDSRDNFRYFSGFWGDGNRNDIMTAPVGTFGCNQVCLLKRVD